MALAQHEFEEAKKCFQLAEKLYVNGDNLVRLLVEDSFIYSVSSMMEHGSKNMFLIKAMLPPTLLTLFQKHLSASHYMAGKKMNTKKRVIFILIWLITILIIYIVVKKFKQFFSY